MSSKINYFPETMDNAAAGVAECAKAAREIGRYAQQHCSLDGAFGILLRPLQPIHNGARDAVMENLTALSEALYASGVSVLAARDDMEQTETDIATHCEGLISESDASSNASGLGGGGGGGGGGDFDGGGGGGGDFGGGGGGPAPVTERPVMQPPVADEPEVPKLPETPGAETPDLGDTDGEDAEDGDTDPEGSDPTKPGEGTDGEGKENGHPVGCRCSECDGHPAGCQCNVCLGEHVQHGCPAKCRKCHSGTSHAPAWVVECGIPYEVASKVGTSEDVFTERWVTREPIVVVRPSEIGGTVTACATLTADSAATVFPAMPGSIAFDFDGIVTAAYAREERSGL